MSEQLTLKQSRSIKLNLFQRTMLQWNEFHPYNAVHVVHVPEHFDLEPIETAVADAIGSLGVGELEFDRRNNPRTLRQSAPFAPIPGEGTTGIKRGPELLVLQNDAPVTLHSHIQRELNTPFLGGPRINPFRFFVQGLLDSF